MCLQTRHLLCQQTRHLWSPRTSLRHWQHRGGRFAAAPVWAMKRGCLGRPQMSCLLTQQMSCLLTQQMFCLQTQQMSCLQTHQSLEIGQFGPQFGCIWGAMGSKMASIWRLRSHVKSRAVARSLQEASGSPVNGGGIPREVKQAPGEEDNRRRARISDAWLTPRGRRISWQSLGCHQV